MINRSSELPLSVTSLLLPTREPLYSTPISCFFIILWQLCYADADSSAVHITMDPRRLFYYNSFTETTVAFLTLYYGNLKKLNKCPYYYYIQLLVLCVSLSTLIILSGSLPVLTGNFWVVTLTFVIHLLSLPLMIQSANVRFFLNRNLYISQLYCSPTYTDCFLSPQYIMTSILLIS